jgi:hypothetical protein
MAVFGTGAVLLEVNSDWLETADSEDWNFGNGDFTIECFANFTGIPTYTNIVSQADAVSNLPNWKCQIADDSIPTNCIVFRAQDSAGNFIASYRAAHGIIHDTTYHLAWMRKGADFYIFKDGVPYTLIVDVAIGSTALPDIAGPLQIGARLGGPGIHWMDEILISKGIARFNPAGFTPPINPYG